MAKPLPRQAALEQLKEFDFARARVSLWVFKKRSAADNTLSFSAAWVDIASRLAKELKEIAKAARVAFTEVGDYGLLQQPNETELLAIAKKDTQFQTLADAVAGREEEHQANSRKDLDNAAGYIVKFSSKGTAILCVRKASSEWRARKSNSLLNLIFVQQQLDIEDDPVFRIARLFDFFAVDDHLLIADKRAFESLLNYKMTYENSFVELRGEKAFVELFSDMTPLQEYVGTNAMQLRRMAVIRGKGLYKDKAYIARLQSVNVARGWGIYFDANGRIAPTDETVRIILQVLLDHRLYSELSLTTYDVPSTTPV
jgi:Domain of unknown function (DUF4868)